jgi:hypothetical protein
MKPNTNEYPSYYQKYIDALETEDVFEELLNQITELEDLAKALSDEDALYRYAVDKWSVKELVGHITDCERIFGYRAMCIARGEQQPLPGFDENAYVSNGDFDGRSIEDLVDEFLACRMANVVLFENFTNEQLIRIGTSNCAPISVRAIIWIIAAHTSHHLRVLQDKYDL